MKLSTKVLLSLVLVFTASFGILYGSMRVVIQQGFEKLELSEADKNLSRCMQAIEREIEHLAAFTYDWAGWDDTYEFINDKNSDYIDSNLVLDTFVGVPLNLIVYIDLAGNPVWGKAYDLETEEEIKLAEFSAESIKKHPILFYHDDINSQTSGILQTQMGPMMVASMPITKSDKGGPIRGALVMGRFLNTDAITTLSQQVRIPFDLHAINLMEPEASGEQKIHKHIRPIEILDQETLALHSEINDIYGKPIAQLKAILPRDIFEEGQNALSFASLTILLLGFAVLIAAWILIHILVVKPITFLTDKVVQIGRTGELSFENDTNRWDEIGLLSKGFGDMTLQLSKAQDKLMDNSYRSGMAEMAMGTLHNLGNAINAITVRTSTLQSNLNELSLDNTDRAISELENPHTDPIRRKKLLEYTRRSFSKYSVLLGTWKSQIEEIIGHIHSTQEILQNQSRVDHFSPIKEEVDIAMLIKDTIAMLPPNLLKDVTIQMEEDLHSLPPVQCERIRLLQVISNILINALEALQISDNSDKTIEISGIINTSEKTKMIQIDFKDSGIGIAQEDLEKIFENGMTTKTNGHQGMGLHWSANTIASMNGRMYATSQGIGYGTTFHTELPLL